MADLEDAISQNKDKQSFGSQQDLQSRVPGSRALGLLRQFLSQRARAKARPQQPKRLGTAQGHRFRIMYASIILVDLIHYVLVNITIYNISI